jgi:hypothetical protein
MAHSRRPGPLCVTRFPPPRTPGALGRNDAAAPDAHPLILGDTPGPLGLRDWADPTLPLSRLLAQKAFFTGDISRTELVIDPLTGRPILLAANGSVPGVLGPHLRKATQAEIDLGKKIVAIALARSKDQIGQSYSGPSKSILSPNPKYKGANPAPDVKAIPTDPVNKCNIYVGDVLYQAGTKYASVTLANGGEKYSLANHFPASNAFTKIGRGDEIIPGDVIVRTLDGIVHVEFVSDVREGRARIAGAIGAHWDGVGPSPLNVDAYNRALSRGKYHARERSFTWFEPDGSRGELYVLRPKAN